MNNQEAIEVLKSFDRCVKVKADGAYETEEFKSARELAIFVLEAQQTDMWIPITEGFPKRERVIACNSEGLQMIGKLTTDLCGDNGEGLGVVCVCNKNSIINVVAWMPLPAPYKEDAHAKEAN